MSDRLLEPLPKSVNQRSAFVVGCDAAVKAGKILKRRFGKRNNIQVKGKRNLVTEADLLSEKAIIETISAEFPDHGILSEESGCSVLSSDYTWIIDPLDGTNNYHFGIPFFCVNIALAKRGEVQVGITYDPLLNEMFHSIKGEGAYLNRKKVTVSSIYSLAKAAIGVDLGYKPEVSVELLEIASKLWKQVHCLRLMGSSSLGMAYVACGRLSLYFHKYIYPWDIASGLLMVREAGGEVANFHRQAAGLKDSEIIAANNKLLTRFSRWLER